MRKRRYSEIIRDLKKIRRRGFIKTHRAGSTGVGKTLEDLLGIKENNFAGPNGHTTELKSGRIGSSSMLVLFTKSMMPRGINYELAERFGHGPHNKKRLHTIVNATSRNTLYGRPAFRLGITGSKMKLTHSSYGGMSVPYWSRTDLRDAFNRKYPENLLYVKAESRGRGINEEFHYNETWLMSGFNFGGFVKLLKKGHIRVDVRIGRYPDGKLHDRNPAFRIPQNRFELFFAKRKKIL